MTINMKRWPGIRHIRWLWLAWGAWELTMRMWDRGIAPPELPPSDHGTLAEIWRGDR